jgi:tetratricopeptide (TPR) repeat protein
LTGYVPCLDEQTVLGFLGGSLPAGRLEQVDEHLASCASCRELVVIAAGSGDRSGDLATTPTLPANAAAIARGRGLPLDSKVGRYVIRGVIGEGGMGVVHAAYDPELDRKIAVKLLRREVAAGDPEAAAARLLREGRAIAKLAHPNVVTVFDIGTHDGAVFVAMELVDGTSLDKWLATTRSWRDVIDVFVQAGRGLIAAHEAGIVHRDFKPANVLLGKDGRARVSDFGLARLEPSERRSSPATAASDDVRLTQSGALLGTPSYMAPEQLDAEPVDERTDQFCFAVALYEGLYGERPFHGNTVASIREAIHAGKPALGRPGRHVPGRLRPLVLRGLAVKPEERHATLGELVAGLAAARRRRAPVWIAAATLALAAVVVFALLRSSDGACSGGRPKIEEVWNADVRANIERAFLATGKPYASSALASVTHSLDDYATKWADMHLDACRATVVRKEQSEDLLDLRMACLAERRDAFRETIEVLGRADADILEHANEVVGQLGEIARCADLSALRSPEPLPTFPVLRAQVEDLRRELSRAAALSRAGKVNDALAFVPTVVSRARQLGYQPFEAEALQILGDLQYEAGDSKDAIASLRAAVVAAEASGHELIVARAWRGLVAAIGLGAGDHAGALEAAEHARAVLGRLDPDGLDMAALQSTLAGVLRDKSDYTAAREAVHRAIAILERKLPAGDPEIARAFSTLGTIEWFDEHADDAIAIFSRVRDDLSRALGPRHPMVGRTYHLLAGVYWERGNLDEALSANQKEIEIGQAALGPEYPDLSIALMIRGLIVMDQGKEEEAIATFLRGLTVAEKLGPDHPRVGALLDNLAVAERRRDQLASAREHAMRALAINEKRFGQDNYRYANTLQTLADIEIDDGKLDDARRFGDRALAIQLVKLRADNPRVAETYITLGELASASGKPTEAIEQVEKAVAIYRQPHTTPIQLAIGLYHEGRVLSASGRHERAEAALRESLAIVEKERGQDHPYVADILTELADALDHHGKAGEASPLIDRALAIRDHTHACERLSAETRAIAARILWQSAPDRDRAIGLARQALAALSRHPGAERKRAALASWMAAHGVR